VLPSPPPISVFISSPSTPTHNLPYFSLFIIYLFTHLSSLQFFKPLEIRHKLHLPTYLTCFLLVFSCLASIHRLFLIFSSAFHRIFCYFWQRVSFQFFGSRSTLLQQQLQDTHLTNGFTGVSRFHRRSLFPSQASAPPRMAHMLQRALCSPRHVDATFALPALHLDRHRCFWASSANPAAERPPLGGACAPRAVMECSHPAFLWTAAVYFIVFLGLLVVFLSPCSPLFW
jgi:hypothetical protein